MKPVLILVQVLSAISNCWAQSPRPQARLEAEYYIAAYAQHYRVTIALVRAIVERESNWQPCAGVREGVGTLIVPKCTQIDWAGFVNLLKNMVGTRRLELLTSTVSK